MNRIRGRAKEQYKEWEIEGMRLRKKKRRGLLSTVAHGDRVGGRSWLSFRPYKSAYHSWVLQRNHHAGNPQRSVFKRLASLFVYSASSTPQYLTLGANHSASNPFDPKLIDRNTYFCMFQKLSRQHLEQKHPHCVLCLFGSHGNR